MGNIVWRRFGILIVFLKHISHVVRCWYYWLLQWIYFYELGKWKAKFSYWLCQSSHQIWMHKNDDVFKSSQWTEIRFLLIIFMFSMKNFVKIARKSPFWNFTTLLEFYKIYGSFEDHLWMTASEVKRQLRGSCSMLLYKTACKIIGRFPAKHP